MITIMITMNMENKLYTVFLTTEQPIQSQTPSSDHGTQNLLTL